MRDCELWFTCRPLSVRPISWANAITRVRTKGLVDHIAYREGDYIYESVVGQGVHRVHMNQWKVGRSGTVLIRIPVPYGKYDLAVWEAYKKTKYDWPALIWLMTGMYKLLKHKSRKRIFCSELIAMMRYDTHPYFVTPFDELKRYKNTKAHFEII